MHKASGYDCRAVVMGTVIKYPSYIFCVNARSLNKKMDRSATISVGTEGVFDTFLSCRENSPGIL